MAESPIVAVVPFGAVIEGEHDERPGRWARQIARRLVDRSSEWKGIELRPVFLVAMPEGSSEAGYLVFGSTPDAKLAAEYGRSLGASHVLTGIYRETKAGRRIEATLIEATKARQLSRLDREVPTGTLQLVEQDLAAWLTSALNAEISGSMAPPTSNEESYAALLEGMDHEVDATLVAPSDRGGSERSILEAAAAYGRSVTAHPGSEIAEERLLVIAAGAVEREDPQLLVPVLERVIEARPRSWRAHYMLGEMRRLSGDTSGAIVALEHADSLHALRPTESLVLAQLHIASGATAVASSRLRRIVRGDAEPKIKATARRLLLGIRHPELEKDLEEAGRIAVEGDPAKAAEAEARFTRVLDAEPEIWEAHFGLGLLAWQRGDDAEAERGFRRAVEIDPAAAELLSDLGRPADN